MSLTTRTIPQLFNGVSRQPAILRSMDQTESELNSWAAASKGVGKRPPTETIAKLSDSISDNAFIHIINRDAEERYVVVIDGETIKIVGFDGVERTVNTPGGADYLTGASEMISNGAFSADATGYTGVNATLAATAGRLRVTGTAANGYAKIVMPTVIGTTYRIRYDLFNGTGTAQLRVGNFETDFSLHNSGAVTGAGQMATFVATAVNTTITLMCIGASGTYSEYDNLSLKEVGVPADLTAVTVADYTFIVNRDKTALMKGVGADTEANPEYVRDPTRPPGYDDAGPVLPGRPGGYAPNATYT